MRLGTATGNCLSLRAGGARCFFSLLLSLRSATIPACIAHPVHYLVSLLPERDLCVALWSYKHRAPLERKPNTLCTCPLNSSSAISNPKRRRAMNLPSPLPLCPCFPLPLFLSSSPPQFVAQDIEVISVHRLHEIERRLALAYHDAVFNSQGKANLAIQCQRHVFLISFQT